MRYNCEIGLQPLYYPSLSQHHLRPTSLPKQKCLTCNPSLQPTEHVGSWVSCPGPTFETLTHWRSFLGVSSCTPCRLSDVSGLENRSNWTSRGLPTLGPFLSSYGTVRCTPPPNSGGVPDRFPQALTRPGRVRKSLSPSGPTETSSSPAPPSVRVSTGCPFVVSLT